MSEGFLLLALGVTMQSLAPKGNRARSAHAALTAQSRNLLYRPVHVALDEAHGALYRLKAVCPGNMAAMVAKVALCLLPIENTIVMIATEMAATMRPYSMAVAPDSFLAKWTNTFVISNSPVINRLATRADLRRCLFA
jgi:hypothetical protein